MALTAAKVQYFFLLSNKKASFFQSKRKNIQKQEKIKDYNQSIMCQRDGFAIWGVHPSLKLPTKQSFYIFFLLFTKFIPTFAEKLSRLCEYLQNKL